MRLIDITKRSLRSLKSAKARTLLTVLAISVGAFALALTLAATNGANRYAEEIVRSNFNPSELIVAKSSTFASSTDLSKPREYNPNSTNLSFPAGGSREIELLNKDDITRLEGIDGVESVRPAISLGLLYLTRDGQRKYSATIQQYTSYKSPELLAGTIPEAIGNGSIILPEGFLESLGFSSADEAIGKSVRIAVRSQLSAEELFADFQSGNTGGAQSKVTERTFKVIAVTKKPSLLVQPGSELYLYANHDDVIGLNDLATKGTTQAGTYASVYVTVRDGTNKQTLQAAQTKIKDAGFGAQSVADTQAIITQVISILQGIVLIFGLIAVVASVFGVINTMYISVLQRTKEIGLMKALGMHRRDILKLFLAEAALIGFLGGAVGAGLAVVLGLSLNPFISSSLSLGSIALLEFSPLQIIELIAVLTLIAIVAGLLPARKAARLDPINALRTE